jgi:hypothetical protein
VARVIHQSPDTGGKFNNVFLSLQHYGLDSHGGIVVHISSFNISILNKGRRIIHPGFPRLQPVSNRAVAMHSKMRRMWDSDLSTKQPAAERRSESHRGYWNRKQCSSAWTMYPPMCTMKIMNNVIENTRQTMVQHAHKTLLTRSLNS